MTNLYPAIGAALALAGGDKLVGNPGYAEMFRQLGWTPGHMRAAAAAEVAGGLLMGPRSTRRLGGAIVAAASAAILLSELDHNNPKLARPRALVFLAGVAALLIPGRRASEQA